MLGENIANIRRGKNISQEQLADALCTSRQAVSKWERGETYPDLDKLKDIATYFGVSIDYLLDFDLASVSVDNFIKRMEEELMNKKLSIGIEEIRVMVSKNNNNFNLLVRVIEYLAVYWVDNPSDSVAQMIVDYGKRAVSIFREDNSLGLDIDSLHKAVVFGYTRQKKYDLAKEYIKENKVTDSAVEMAECDYQLGNYDVALESLSNTFLESIATIVNGNMLQVQVLLKTNKINDAYELINWTASFINSVGKTEDLLFDITYALLCFKATCERHLGLEFETTLNYLKDNISRIDKKDGNSDEVKFYYNKRSDYMVVISSLKDEIKQVVDNFKDAMIYQDMLFIYNDLFGEKINE